MIRTAAWRLFAPVLALGACLLSGPAFAAEPTERMCFLIARGVEGKFHIIPSHVRVLDSTQGSEPFSVENPPGFTVVTIECFRSDLVPAPNDYKVALAGYQLDIGVIGGPSGQLLGELQLENGKFTFRMVTGKVPSEDEAPIADRLKAFEAAVAHRP